MKNYNQSVKINHNSSRYYIGDYSYKIFITDGSGSGKTNVLLNLIRN